MRTFEDALGYAELAHRGQTRKNGDDRGKPYIIHPMRIAEKISDPISKQAAILHDVIEDGAINGGPITAERLLDYGFDPEVVEIVTDLTRREGETYYDFIMRLTLKDKSADVKILDIEDNMNSPNEGSLKDKYRLSRLILQNRKNLFRS